MRLLDGPDEVHLRLIATKAMDARSGAHRQPLNAMRNGSNAAPRAAAGMPPDDGRHLRESSD